MCSGVNLWHVLYCGGVLFGWLHNIVCASQWLEEHAAASGVNICTYEFKT